MTLTAIIILMIISLIISAFFSGIEIAFYQANPLKIELDKNTGMISSRLLSYLSAKPIRFITNSLVGNNIALIIFGIGFTQLINFLYPYTGIFGLKQGVFSFIIMSLVSGFLILIFAEFIPKAIFIRSPNRLLNNFIFPFYLIYLILFPLNLFFIGISNIILRILKYKTEYPKTTFEYHHLFSIVDGEEVDTTSDNNVELDTKILKNAIELPGIKVRECMVPRPEITFIDISENITELKALFIKSRHSKIIVVNNDIEHIVGYVHNIDLYSNPESINNILRPVFIVPESMPVNKMLKMFMSSKTSIGHVVDEYGGTAGIISIEDVLEEIVGEIEDEYDNNELKEVRINENEFIFSARHEIDYLNSKYNINIPEGDYTTLGGYILELKEDFPVKGEIINTNRFVIKIIDASFNKIDEVSLKIIDEEN